MAATIGILGAGRLGRTLARLAHDAGLRVRIASSGPAARTRRVTELWAVDADAVEAADVATGADVVVLAVPLEAHTGLDPAVFAGHVVVDAMNHWPETDGVHPEWEDPAHPTSTLVQARLPDARVVKAFNHVSYHDLSGRARPAGTPGRVAVGVAGDDADAVERVSGFVDRLGFEPVVVGGLEDSGVLEPYSPLFGMRLDGEALRTRLDRDGTGHGGDREDGV